MTKTYTEEDIRVIGEIEHVQLNPSMYVGDTTNPVHLIEECLDNSLDEALAGYANIIAINIDTKSNIYTVMDNGRGIPIGNDIPIIISTKLFSGAKFQDKKSVYRISSGLHGIGLVAICALSDCYIIELYRDNKYAYYEFQNTKLKKKSIKSFSGERPFSTKIQFKPSKKVFENLVPDLDRIRRRLTVASAEMSDDKTFVLNVDGQKEVFHLSLQEYFKKYCLNSNDALEIINLESFVDPESFNIIMSYVSNGTVTPKVYSSVNLLPVELGGTHVNCFYDMLREFFVAKAKKLKYRFYPQDCLIGLRAHLMLNLIEPKFSGQTKDRLTNRRVYLDKIVSQLKTKLENYFLENEDYLELLLNRFQDYRKKIDSKKLKNVQVRKRGSTKFTKLRDCTSRNGELFIVEGDSAGGTINQCRDPRLHAILPLKGKVPNIVSTRNILKNKEIGEMIYAFGTGVGVDFNLVRLRYGKIICAADSDPDGGHIASLIMMIVAVLTPDIIKEGKFYIARTPLYAINEKNVFVPLWEDDELKKARSEKRYISRFKGLGELNPKQLKACLIDHNTRKLIQVDYTSDIDKLTKLFSDVDVKRKLLQNRGTI